MICKAATWKLLQAAGIKGICRSVEEANLERSGKSLKKLLYVGAPG